MSTDWKDDPMNSNDAFMRVSFRRKIMKYDSEKTLSCHNKIRNYGKVRHEIESKAVLFLKNREFCNFSDFGYAVINFSEFCNESKEVQHEILNRVIWNIGCNKYIPSIGENIIADLMIGKCSTFGKCLLRLHRGKILIFRENRNLNTAVSVDLRICENCVNLNYKSCEENTTIIKSYILNNFLITVGSKDSEFSGNVMHDVLHAGLYDNLGLPKNITFRLPCIYQGNRIVFTHGIGYFDNCHEHIGVKCTFMNKLNLFDVFL
jgi:hypothetical protein